MSRGRTTRVVVPGGTRVAFAGDPIVLDTWGGALETGLGLALDLAEAALGPLDVDVTVYCDENDVIPEWGVGGYSVDRGLVLVAIDPSMPANAEGLARTLVHELHHTRRRRDASLGATFADVLVGEGLAVLFEAEPFGGAPLFDGVDLPPVRVDETRSLLAARDVDRGRWLHGAADVPRYFGYALGHALCREFAASRHASAASLAAVPTNDVVAAFASRT